MRIMNVRYTNKKKVRGLKRKCKAMIRRIEAFTSRFPDVDLENGYWHLHLPLAQTFIDSSKTPFSVRRLCVQTLIDGVAKLIEKRAKLNVSSRVVTVINLPILWHSQIIVFFGEEYFDGFFDRNNKYQKWTLFPESRSLIKEWNLHIPDNFGQRGYLEELTDEDFKFQNELWYFGELN